MNDTRIESFDYLRLFAMALVTIQHAMAVHGYYDQTTWRGVNVGQTGVAIFCALSGYLAFQLDLNKPLVWFKRRLVQIFPAYWVVTIVSFALTLIAGSKDVTWSLFISQMLGTGFFTHGWELVNVVSWFVSLILLCYVIALVALFTGHVNSILILVIVVPQRSSELTRLTLKKLTLASRNVSAAVEKPRKIPKNCWIFRST